jgi:hypothetical protein
LTADRSSAQFAGDGASRRCGAGCHYDLPKGDKMDAVVAISRTWKALRRASFVADDRRDLDEVPRIGQFWKQVDAAEMMMPARDCQAKLKCAAYKLFTGGFGGDDLAVRLLRVGVNVVRIGPELGQLIELRDCLASLWDIEPELDIGVVENVQPRIEAAIAWLAQLRCVSSQPSSE